MNGEPIPMPANQSTPEVTRDDGTAFGRVQCHCSEDDGIPDVGVSIGLGDGKALWIGELLTRDGATCGMVFHDNGARIVAPFADGTDWQEAADILRHCVGPALNPRTPARGGDELREALEQIAINSNCDWDHVRKNPAKQIEMIHTLAVDALYGKALASTDMAGAEKLAQDSETLAAQATSTSEAEQLRAYARGIRRGAALSAPPVEGLTSGEGWQAVPVEPADPMLLAGCAIPGVSLSTGRRMWAAMLAASPKATATVIVQEEAVTRVTAAWSVMMRKFGGAFGDIDNGYFPEVEEMRRSVASLTDTGTAATIGGERA